ncbi:uncharacterized protein LOC119745464 [Patiria miniata]|uniref:Uncharacterized protein n=1 Tax=Patiria miniata TaxID=46514 RepID=A0A914BQI4_PATMI|nr:uncharacterized protein LOC119745464 [Patiria miniata]
MGAVVNDLQKNMQGYFQPHASFRLTWQDMIMSVAWISQNEVLHVPGSPDGRWMCLEFRRKRRLVCGGGDARTGIFRASGEDVLPNSQRLSRTWLLLYSWRMHCGHVEAWINSFK